MAQVKFLEKTERYSSAAAPLVGYFIAPTGNDSTGAGTEASPWATIGKFHTSAAAPGDTLYLRGGTYNISAQVTLTKSGSSGARITLRNYPGETPILTGINNPNSGGHSVLRISTGVNYWNFYGLEVAYSPGYGFYLVGTASNITIENCNIHHNVRLDASGGGINAEIGSNVWILNNDAHHNGHSPTEGGSGIALSDSKETGNIIRGNRMWRNNDNGLALWNAANVLVENNWIWENGYDDALASTSPGDGVAFKLAGGGTGDGAHIVRYNLAWHNRSNGFDQNDADLALTVYNNTAYENVGANFNFHTVAHTLKNNLSKGSVNVLSPVAHTFNSWNTPPGVTVTNGDFITTDFTANTGARQSDGSLPASNFLKLAPGSDLIDAGTDVGLPFNGSAPDIGAFET